MKNQILDPMLSAEINSAAQTIAEKLTGQLLPQTAASLAEKAEGDGKAIEANLLAAISVYLSGSLTARGDAHLIDDWIRLLGQ